MSKNNKKKVVKWRRRKNQVTAKLILAPNILLNTVCEPVKDNEDVSSIIRDMMYILFNSKTGVGLAAPQVGCLKRIILIKAYVEYGYIVMINPKWRKLRSGVITMDESCLSYPGASKKIDRFGSITVDYTSENGISVIGKRFDNFEARIVQHEIDHLEGKCKVGEI